ncbi:hypothetical protein CWB41_09470 [Methylovirgula ligni]|nr:hypothetical protein CWB41_09470 [Methylovirgula ligni]
MANQIILTPQPLLLKQDRDYLNAPRRAWANEVNHHALVHAGKDKFIQCSVGESQPQDYAVAFAMQLITDSTVTPSNTTACVRLALFGLYII